jgi:hypothetical protein
MMPKMDLHYEACTEGFGTSGNEEVTEGKQNGYERHQGGCRLPTSRFELIRILEHCRDIVSALDIEADTKVGPNDWRPISLPDV